MPFGAERILWRVLVLVVRPAGLFGRVVVKRV